MSEGLKIEHIKDVVVLFAGDSGDGMQLAGNIFSTISATVGNSISTFPNYPADIRAPQGSLTGVSGFQVHVGAEQVYTPGDKCDVLVAMNAAALKTQYKHTKPNATIIIDTDSFQASDLKKAAFQTDNYLEEMNIDPDRVICCPLTQMVKDTLADSGMDNKAILKCRNMFALGLVCWLFDRDLNIAFNFLREKFSKKPALAEANIKVIQSGYDYGHNTHSTALNTYRIETKSKVPGRYMDITGNKATAYGLIAAAEKAGLKLYLGSYPITPATDILHELSKHKSLGVTTVQCEDEIAGCASAIGASFAGAMAVTSTSGPGICLKSEAMNLAVIMELPLVVIDVQRGGPATGLPTKSEQTDLLQALFGRNGESPMVVMASHSPAHCFEAAFTAAKIAMEHMTPVLLLSEGFLGNGSEPWKIPSMSEYPDIKPRLAVADGGRFHPFERDAETLARKWAPAGTPGLEHRVGGLEKTHSGVLSTNAANHELMVKERAEKVARVAADIPDLVIDGPESGDVLLVGWGGTYGHILSATEELRAAGKTVSRVHFDFIDPLPRNTEKVLSGFRKIIVCELNLGQFAGYLKTIFPQFNYLSCNKVQGQTFLVKEIVDAALSEL